MKTEEIPFWLVWCPHGDRPPRYRHPSRSAAEIEAARLARENPGQPFYVLAPVTGVRKGQCRDQQIRDAGRDPVLMIAALYVEKGGCYYGLPDVDPWPIDRDARLYDGPCPVVAHPPCARWGRYWGGAPGTWPRLVKGDDGGCFAAALAAVRLCGGILEHPEGSHAWREFALNLPPRDGGWVNADFSGGWTCCVEQGAYGHRARKATWLYACRVELPSLKWGRAPGDFVRIEEGFHSIEERRRRIKTGVCQRLSHRERAATPIPFRDLLLSIARTAHWEAA